MVSILDEVNDLILWAHYNSNEYQGYLVGVKTAGA